MIEKDEEDVSAETFSEDVDREDPNHYQRPVGHSRADAHHRQLHQACFSIRAESGQGESRFVFTRPGGRTIETALFPQFPDVSAETPEVDFGQLAPNVTPTTCVPRWYGERCDYGMAVDGLLRRDAAR